MNLMNDMKTIFENMTLRQTTITFLTALLLAFGGSAAKAQIQCLPQFITQVTFSSYYDGWRAADAIEVRAQSGAPSGYIIAGSTDLLNPGLGEPQLVLTDLHGNVVEKVAYALSTTEQLVAEKVLQTRDSNGLLDGFIFIATESDPTAFEGGGTSFYLVKVDNDLALEWVRKFDTPTKDNVTDLIHTRDGNYAITGHTRQSTNTLYQTFIHKIDLWGGDVWHKTYVNAHNNWAYGMTEDSKGDILVTGTINEGGEAKAYLMKADGQTGALIWYRAYGVNSMWNAGFAVIQTRDGGYAITGKASDTNSLVSNWPILITTDGDGYLQESYRYNDATWTSDAAGYSLYEVTQSGCPRFFIISGTWNKHGFVMKTYGQNIEFIRGIKNTNPTQAAYEAVWANNVVSMDRTRNNGLLLAGHGDDKMWLIKTMVEGFVPPCQREEIPLPISQFLHNPQHNQDITTAVMSGIPGNMVNRTFSYPDVTLTQPCFYGGDKEEKLKTSPAENLSSTVFPNPSKGTFTVQYADHVAEGTPVRLLNSIGQTVWEGSRGAATVQRLELTDLPAGTYFFRIGHEQTIRLAIH